MEGEIMNRKTFFMRALVGFMVLLMAAPAGTMAQSSETRTAFTQEELDQMLAPVALYPDSLLAQILVAATFPNEVVEADQWVQQNESLKGDRLNGALDKMEWDLSVKALVPFPKVLAMMSDKREWTQKLGDAFLAQQTQVMDTVQSLRSKAHAQGNLKSNEQQRVVVKGDSIEIEPANPRVVYVPAYNPTVIYGSWWHPAHPPFAYNPYYPRYVYDPHYSGAGFITAGVFGFAAGIAVGSAWNGGWGRWDWRHRAVHVNVVRTININRNVTIRNIRTTNNVNRVVTQRRVRAPERAGLRATGQRGAGVRPSTTAVQKDLQQGKSKAQVRQSKKAAQSKQTAVRSDRGQRNRGAASGKAIGAARRDDDKVSRGGGKASRGEGGRASRGEGKASRGGDDAGQGGGGQGGDGGKHKQ